MGRGPSLSENGPIITHSEVIFVDLLSCQGLYLGCRRDRETLARDLAIICVVALREAFYSQNQRFDLDTMRAPNRSPTPISKSNDFLGQSDDFGGARGPHFRSILGVPGVRAAFQNTYFLAL